MNPAFTYSVPAWRWGDSLTEILGNSCLDIPGKEQEGEKGDTEDGKLGRSPGKRSLRKDHPPPSGPNLPLPSSQPGL